MAAPLHSAYEADAQWQSQSAPTRPTSAAMPAGVTQSPTSAAGPESLAGPSPHASAGRGPQYASPAPQTSRPTEKSSLKRPKEENSVGGSPKTVGKGSRDGDEETGEPQPKRAKMALSCSECKRRKIKCDRNIPCMACIKRGAEESCNWDDAKIEPSPQPFALKTEVYDLSERVRAVEQFLEKLPLDGRMAAPSRHFIMPPPFPESSGEKESSQPEVRSAPLEHRLRVPSLVDSGKNSSRASEEDYNDAAEDAANALESVAFNPRSNRPGQSSQSIISHEYWRGSMTAGGANSRKVEYAAPEYTAARTIIKAPPCNPALDRYNPVMMFSDIDWDNPQQITQHRTNLVSGLLAKLPTVRQSFYLAAQYHDAIDWRYHVLHWSSFQAEMELFWEMAAQRRAAEVDPLWLAVFFMVMALGLDNRPAKPTDANNPFNDKTDEELGNLVNLYHTMSVRALHLGNSMSTPKLRTIQAIILFNQFFQTSPAWAKADMLLNWIALGIRTAQLLGLHTLGKDPEVMPPDDPAWPPGKNAIKRHMALRTWMVLQWADWMSASARFRSYMIHPEQCTSQVVDNINDWELSATDWHYTPHPPNVVTSTSFDVYKWHIASMVRETYDKLITHANTFTYSTVLGLDQGYRRILENLPDPLRRAPLSPETEDPKLRWQRNIALEGIHSRIIRLHRPFLSRGYAKGSKFARSREQCLRSARLIVDCHYNLRDLTTTGTFWFIYSHTLGAAIVLFLDFFWSIDNDLPPSELMEKMRVISLVQEIFSIYSKISNPSLRKIVESSFQIISDLTAEGQARQSSRSARCFSPNKYHLNPNPPSFAEVLRRISSKFSIEEGPKGPDQGPAGPNPAMQFQQKSMVPPPIGNAPPAWGQNQEYQVPQSMLNSGFYSALGVPTQDAMNDPAFANLWAYNMSPASQAESPANSQLDLLFLVNQDQQQQQNKAGVMGQPGDTRVPPQFWNNGQRVWTPETSANLYGTISDGFIL